MDLSSILFNQIKTYQGQSIDFSGNFDASRSVFISGDKQQIIRLLQNALSNAASFAKSKVTVSLRIVNSFVQIEVIDDGPGLSEERIQHFGQKFKSREVVNKNRISLGLGAVIMKKIALAHGGDVSISNQVISNKVMGAKLAIILPLKEYA